MQIRSDLAGIVLLNKERNLFRMVGRRDGSVRSDIWFAFGIKEWRVFRILLAWCGLDDDARRDWEEGCSVRRKFKCEP